MAGELKLRRGTTQQHETFTGAQAEVTVDTDTNSLVVHDGVTLGGFRVPNEEAFSAGDVAVSGFSGGKYEAIASGNTLTISGTPTDELTGEPKFHVGRRCFVEGEARTITEVAEVEGNTQVTVDGAALSAGSVWAYLGPSRDKPADPLFFPVTDTEQATGFTPVDFSVPPHHAPRYGLAPDTDADLTAAFEMARTALPDGGELVFPHGTYRLNGINDRLELRAESKKTKLQPYTSGDVILSLGRHLPDWDWHTVTGFTFDGSDRAGNARASSGVDFEDPNYPGTGLGGRWRFVGVNFQNCDVGIHHKSGNIGNRYIDCNFRLCNYGVRHEDLAGPAIMHSGAVVYDGCEFSGISKAAILIKDSEIGMGGYDFQNIIVEDNDGFGVYIDAGGVTPFAGISFRNFWGENNCNAETVEIDGVTMAPREIYIKDTSPVVFTGSFLKDVQLVNSTLIAKECRIDDSSLDGLNLTVDADSALICDDLFMDGGVGDVPFVRSIAYQRRASNTLNQSVRGPLATHRAPAGPGTVLWKENYDGAGPWHFSGTAQRGANSVEDGVISETCAELTIPNGYDLVAPAAGTPTPGKWAVWGIHAKLVSGSVPDKCELGHGFTFGRVYLRAGEWVRSYGIQKVPASGGGANRLYIVNNTGGDSTIRFADSFVIEFDSLEDALAFCNARAAVR